MNILIVSLDNSKEVLLGGKHIHQELIEKGFIELGHSVDCCYPSNKRIISPKRILFKLLSIIGAGLQFYSFKHKIETYISMIESSMDNFIKLKKYDFILAEDTVSAFAVKKYFKKSGNKIPMLLTLHGYFPRETLNYGYYNSSNKQKVFEYCISIEKDSVSAADAVITVDTRIKNYVADELSRDKNVFVIFNAIDDNRFFPVEKTEIDNFRKELNIDLNKKILLIARRFVLKNGVHFGIEAAMQLISAGYKEIQLIIAGDGPEKDNLTGLVNKYNINEYVKFVGSINHSLIDKYYKCCDILLMPSTKSDDVEEATSLSMLEGMICGKVVIASAIGGMKEVIKDGYNGMLVEDKKPEQIVRKVIELINDRKLYDRISHAAHEYTKKNHAYKNHAEKFIEIYIKLK